MPHHYIWFPSLTLVSPSTGSEPHVVAADNIELLSDASHISDDMFPLAGKFFKKFDRETCTFVSNIKEQYPDD